MKKANRLNQELFYLNDKKIFHLKSLENKFGISERTALRDLNELEEMGLAFYPEKGRYGGYHLLRTKFFLPLRFSSQEINAIFFALQAIKQIAVTPYSHDYDLIKAKLLEKLPRVLRQKVETQQNLIHYYSQPSLSQVKYFQPLLEACLHNNPVIAVNEQYVPGKQELQILNLFYQTGNWFCHAYNLKNHRWYILRLDKFEQVKSSKGNQAVLIHTAELRQSFIAFQKKYHYLNYKCLITAAGAKQVRYNLYPDMKIRRRGQHLYLVGKFNPEEKHYLVAYFLSLGKEIKVIKPDTLRRSYAGQLKRILKQYNN